MGNTGYKRAAGLARAVHDARQWRCMQLDRSAALLLRTRHRRPNDRHFDARIIEVRPHRIEDELHRGRVVIVAGYQGMSYPSWRSRSQEGAAVDSGIEGSLTGARVTGTTGLPDRHARLRKGAKFHGVPLWLGGDDAQQVDLVFRHFRDARVRGRGGCARRSWWGRTRRRTRRRSRRRSRRRFRCAKRWPKPKPGSKLRARSSRAFCHRAPEWPRLGMACRHHSAALALPRALRLPRTALRTRILQARVLPSCRRHGVRLDSRVLVLGRAQLPLDAGPVVDAARAE